MCFNAQINGKFGIKFKLVLMPLVSNKSVFKLLLQLKYSCENQAFFKLF